MSAISLSLFPLALLAAFLSSCAGSKVNSDKTRAEGYHEKAVERYEKEDYVAALEYMDSVISLDSNQITAWSNKGIIEMRMNKTVEAHSSLSNAIMLIEDINFSDIPRYERYLYGRTYQRRSTLRHSLGDSTGAVEDQKMAKKYGTKPANPIWWQRYFPRIFGE